MNTIETDCTWVILNLKIVGANQNQNHHVCGGTVILLVKEFHITILEFEARD